MNIWDILGIIAGIGVVAGFFLQKNAIWGALTVGGLIGLIAATVGYFSKGSFNWLLCKRIAISFVVLGMLIEVWGRIGDALMMRKIHRIADKRVREQMKDL